MKKCKDLRIRAIVKDLKKQKQAGSSQKVYDLEKELQQIKRLDIEPMWIDLCNLKTLNSTNEQYPPFIRSELVMEHLENMKTIQGKIKEVQNGIAERDQDDGDSTAEKRIESTIDAKAVDMKKSKDGENKKKPKKPKNRMGQRARQRLAEKLHGTAAKHKQKEANKPCISRKETKPNKKSEPELPLHPSWVAKKQMEAIKIHMNGVSSKKIVFD
jgi:hypothetical protein